MNKVLLTITLLLVACISNGQSKTKPAIQKPANQKAVAAAPADPVLMTIAGENITRSEFERVFKKNNYKDSATDEKSVREYLELYINYKLKVKEAESAMMDTNSTFINELAGYRKQLAQPYLTDREVADHLLTEAYDRLKKDINASHILIQLKQDALPKDTLAAFQRASKIREMIMKGADFSKVARDSSDDPSAKENGGDLGYFTGLQMVYPFESAAYNLKNGEVSQPVRTRFGYHLIKKNSERPAQGEMHAAHIMFKAPKDAGDSTINAAKAKADMVYQKLKEGMSWDSAVTNYSDDKASAKRGGELAWFGTGRMVPEFEKAAFALSKDGEYTAPVKTAYGFHIIKRLEKRAVPSFDEKKGELKQAIARDSRNDMSRISMLNKIKSQYRFTANAKNKTAFINSLDTSVANGDWDLNKAEKFNAPLLTLTDSTGNITVYTQQDFAKYISTHQSKRPGVKPEVIGDQLYNSWVDETLIAFEEKRLDSKYPEFRNLMKEYRDGILLFDLTDQKVWSKAVKDTTGMKEFYEQNKTKYMWPERVDASIYSFKDAATAAAFRKQMKKGKKNVNEIVNDLNKSDPSNVILVKSGKFAKGDNATIDKAAWVKGLSDDISNEGKTEIVVINEVLSPQPKQIDEAKGLITADYQNHLEKSWIAELRNKYPVQVNNDVLQTLWK